MSENGIVMDNVANSEREVHESLVDDDETIRKKFLFRLVVALHNAGNLSFRTETYVRDVALAFDMHATCTVFPVSATLAFQVSSNHLNAGTSDSYSITICKVLHRDYCLNSLHL